MSPEGAWEAAVEAFRLSRPVRGYLWSGYHPEMCIQEVLVGALQAVYQVVKKDLEQHRTLCSVSIFVVRCFAAAGTRLALNQRDTRSFCMLQQQLGHGRSTAVCEPGVCATLSSCDPRSKTHTGRSRTESPGLEPFG